MRKMGHRIVATAWVGAVTAMLGLVPPAAAQEDASVTAGARVYGAMCGRCHNPRSPLERSDRAWVVIANHMRVRGNLTGRQVRDVLAFLQAINGDPRERLQLDSPTAAPGPVAEQALAGPASTDSVLIAKGRQLIEQKACLGCHVVRGEGGRVGPDLDGVVKRRSIAFIRQKMADPTIDNATSMMPNFGLTGDEIEAVVAYLASLQGK